MEIRKLSVGPDYKSGAMHYIVGQEILGNSHKIHLIRFDAQTKSVKIWIEKSVTEEIDEILLWKEFSSNMPVSIEYNINF